MNTRNYWCLAVSAFCAMSALVSGKEVPPLVMEWSNFVGDTYLYSITEAGNNALRIELQTKAGYSVATTNQFTGGILGISTIAERAADEISTNRTQIPSRDEKCKLTLKVMSQGASKKVSVEGDLKPLLDFCRVQPSLRELLEFVSQDLPKKYRLLEKAGPLKQFLPLPTR